MGMLPLKTNQTLHTKTDTLVTKQDKKLKANQSKHVETKTLAEMEFDVEEYKHAKNEEKTVVDELKAKLHKLKKGLNTIMKDKKPARRNIGPAQEKLFNPTVPVTRINMANRRGKSDLSVPVKLYISGRNLKDLDTFSKSDPICVVFERAVDNENLWFEVGRTEFVKDDLNPDFKRPIDIDFFFEREQILKFEFIDDDGGDDNDPYYDTIGMNIMSLSSIMASRG